MKNRLMLAAATVMGLIFATAPTSAGERLSLRVTPNVSSAPSTVTVRAYVTPNANNRFLIVEADSGSFYRSSEIQLDGDKAPTLTEFKFASMPSGEYTVTAMLKDTKGTEALERRTIMVLSKWGEPPAR